VLLKQEFVLADFTDAHRGVIWQEQVSKLKEDCLYKLINVTVRLDHSMGQSVYE